MAGQNQALINIEEGNSLNTAPGSGGSVIPRQGNVSSSHYKHHRKLAICSIICGISCIGIKALINSVKAEHMRQDERAAAKFSQLAKKYGIISIVVWVVLLASFLPLMALVSYLFTLSD